MSITIVRIDDRLVHGQVVESWLPAYRIGRVVVVSDEAATDTTQQALMRLAIPDNVALDVFSANEAAKRVRAMQETAERVMVLAPGPREVLALLEGGARFQKVNVGGLHYCAGRVRLGKIIFLDEQDKRALQAISAQGVTLEGQTVPSEHRTDLAELLCESPK